MESINIKQESHRLVDDLNPDATWDDIINKIYIRQAIEAGLKDSDAGRTIDVKPVREKFGLSH